MKDTVTKDEYNFRTEVEKGFRLVEWNEKIIEGDEYSTFARDGMYWLPVDKTFGTTPKYWFDLQNTGHALINLWAFRRKVQINETEQLKDRIQKALNCARSFGGYDGSHHKMWTIDQIVRELTGCPTVTQNSQTREGIAYSYDALGQSDEYKQWVKETKAGVDGPNTYDWDTGIAP